MNSISTKNAQDAKRDSLLTLRLANLEQKGKHVIAGTTESVFHRKLKTTKNQVQPLSVMAVERQNNKKKRPWKMKFVLE